MAAKKKFSVILPVEGTALFVVEAETPEAAKLEAKEELATNGTKYSEGVDVGLNPNDPNDIEVHEGG